MPDTLTTIGSQAFFTTRLTTITIPPSVVSIGESAFSAGANNWISVLNTVNFSGSSLTTLSNYAFARTFVTSVTIPPSIVTIGDGAFYGCSELAELVLSGNSLTYIGADSFYGTDITSITIPPTLTILGQRAFAYCPFLNIVTFSEPSSLETINTNAFQNCTLLVHLTLPLSLTLIATSAFQGCTSLLSVTIPQNVVFIDTNAFQGCTSIGSVVFNCRNNALTILGQNCFAGTTSINPSNNDSLYSLIAKGYNVGGLNNYNLQYAGFNTTGIPTTPPHPPYVPCFNEGTKILCFNLLKSISLILPFS